MAIRQIVTGVLLRSRRLTVAGVFLSGALVAPAQVLSEDLRDLVLNDCPRAQTQLDLQLQDASFDRRAFVFYLKQVLGLAYEPRLATATDSALNLHGSGATSDFGPDPIWRTVDPNFQMQAKECVGTLLPSLGGVASLALPELAIVADSPMLSDTSQGKFDRAAIAVGSLINPDQLDDLRLIAARLIKQAIGGQSKGSLLSLIFIPSGIAIEELVRDGISNELRLDQAIILTEIALLLDPYNQHYSNALNRVISEGSTEEGIRAIRYQAFLASEEAAAAATLTKLARDAKLQQAVFNSIFEVLGLGREIKWCGNASKSSCNQVVSNLIHLGAKNREGRKIVGLAKTIEALLYDVLTVVLQEPPVEIDHSADLDQVDLRATVGDVSKSPTLRCQALILYLGKANPIEARDGVIVATTDKSFNLGCFSSIKQPEVGRALIAAINSVSAPDAVRIVRALGLIPLQDPEVTAELVKHTEAENLALRYEAHYAIARNERDPIQVEPHLREILNNRGFRWLLEEEPSSVVCDGLRIVRSSPRNLLDDHVAARLLRKRCES